MSSSASVSILGTEFDDFLFAPIGEDRNDTPLSVLSVLARLDIDPWQEADKLARLPGEACLRVQSSKLYHLGFRSSIARNTLANANATRDWRIYRDFAQSLIGTARRLYADEAELARIRRLEVGAALAALVALWRTLISSGRLADLHLRRRLRDRHRDGRRAERKRRACKHYAA
jgi:hypothetical protein